MACWYIHRLVKKTEHYEIRLYGVYTFINTPYERRDEGYLVLGAYMDGQNSESAKMNQTQPVVMRYEPATVVTHLPVCATMNKQRAVTLHFKTLACADCALLPSA